MALLPNSEFRVKNGLVVNTNLIWANNGQIGFNTASPDANVTIVGQANVQGNTAITLNLSIGGNTTIGNNATVGRTLAVGANASVNGSLTVNGAANIVSNANVGGTLGVYGNTAIQQRLTVGNTALFNGPLTVNADFTQISGKNAYLNSPVNITNTGGLNVNSAALFYSTVSVNSTCTVNGQVLIYNTATVANTGTFQQEILVQGNSTVWGNTTANGGAQFNNTVIVTGAANLNSTLYVGANATFAGTNTEVQRALRVVGNAQFEGNTLVVLGSANVYRTVQVGGNTVLAGNTVTVNGDVYLANSSATLYANVSSQFNNTVTINATATIRGGTLTVNSATTISNTTTFTGPSVYSSANIAIANSSANVVVIAPSGNNAVVTGNMTFNSVLSTTANLVVTGALVAPGNNAPGASPSAPLFSGALAQVLQSNGAGGVFWGQANLAAGAAPGTADQIMFNRSGALGGCNQIMFYEANSTMTVNSVIITSNNLTVGSSQYFLSNGAIGFGLNNPTYRLQVHSSANTGDGILYRNTSTNASSYAFVTAVSGGASGISMYQVPGGTGVINVIDNAPLWFASNNSTKMALSANGNFGIGTTSPTQLLHVSGGRIMVTSSSYITNPTGAIFGQYSTYGYIQAPSGGYISIWDPGSYSLADFVNTYIRFGTGGTNALYINSSGYVGINGVGSASYPLQVSGAIYASGIVYSRGYQTLDTNNYNSYVPTLTGGGASGTWSINVTGSSSYSTTSGTATNQSGGTVSATTGTFSGAIGRSTTTGGFFQGNYSSVETGSTPGAIYTIGGAHMPTSTTLGNMYGIGYGIKGGTAIGTVGGSSTQTWGLYGASGGTPRWFLDSDGGNGWFNGNLYVNNGYQVVYNSGSWSINVSGSAGSINGYTMNQNLTTGNSPTFATLYAQVFYDSAGTYYCDPNNISLLYQLRCNETWYQDWDGNARMLHARSSDSYYRSASTSAYHVFQKGDGTVTHYLSNEGDIYAKYHGWFRSQIYSSIIYSYEAPSYYMRAGGTSNMNSINAQQLYSYGNIYAQGDVYAYYSDKRLKTVIGTIENAIDKVMSLSGVVYKNNDLAKSLGYDSQEEQVGVIAQQVKEVLPQVVRLAAFDIDFVDGKEVSKSGENYLTVKYDKIIPLLIEAIKEQQIRIQELEKKIG